MDIKLIEEELMKAKQTNDESYIQKYIDDLVAFISEKGITKETLTLVIDGFDLDHGVNALDAFNAMEQKVANETWEKVICKVTAASEIDGENCLKLLCEFAASSMGGESNTEKLLGIILNTIIRFVKTRKLDNKKIAEILLHYLLEEVPASPVLPEWDSIIKMSSENKMKICEMINEAFMYHKEMNMTTLIPAHHPIKIWIAKGREYAEMDIELKEKNKNKLPRMSDEISKLAEHYRMLEDEYEKSLHELAMNALEIRKLKEEIQQVNSDYREATRIIADKDKEIKALNTKVSNAKQEVNERKMLNDAQEQYREDAMESMKQDIAKALKAEYGDYKESKDVAMSEMLGEIYREKLKQIFRILEQKGIRVEE